MTASERIREARSQNETRTCWALYDRVSYEDMSNPRREGTILEVRGDQYRVGWDSEYSWLGPDTWSDLRQCGWKAA